MRRFIATVFVAAIGTTLVGAGIALAADIEVRPLDPGEGEAELTIDVSDFAPDTPIYALPCDIPAAGEELDVTTANCDIAEVATTVTDATGAATIVVDWTIPAGGIAVYVGDEARANEATQIVTPGQVAVDLDNPDAVAPEEPEVAVLGTSVVQEDLADTGPRETMMLLMVAAVAIGLGVALQGVERLRTPT